MTSAAGISDPSCDFSNDAAAAASDGGWAAFGSPTSTAAAAADDDDGDDWASFSQAAVTDSVTAADDGK